MANTKAQQSTPMLLLCPVFKWTTCKATLPHCGSQFQWSKQKQILTIQHPIREHRDACFHKTPPLQRNKAKRTDKAYWTFRYNMMFFSFRKPWNFHNTERWISFLFRAVCLSICLSVYLSVCLSVYLSVYLSVCLSVCLTDCVCLSLWLSVPVYKPANCKRFVH